MGGACGFFKRQNTARGQRAPQIVKVWRVPKHHANGQTTPLH